MGFKPRIQRIEQKYAGNGIFLAWDNPDSDIGSVLLYRADDGKYGTYSIVSTVGTGSNIYTDTAGSEDSWYKLQFWDGTGSSPYSDVISLTKGGYLCTDSDVRGVLKLSANQDEIGSDEIETAILDSQNDLYTEFGKPLRKTHTVVSDLGSKYWLKENREPIYRLDRLEVAGSEINVGSYEVNVNDGTVILNSTFNDAEYGEIMEFEFVPVIYNLLCKNMAAKQLLDDFTIIDGEETKNPKIKELDTRIKNYRNKITNVKIPFGSTQYEGCDERDSNYVNQEWLNEYS